jgi:hypothetical protein
LTWQHYQFECYSICHDSEQGFFYTVLLLNIRDQSLSWFESVIQSTQPSSNGCMHVHYRAGHCKQWWIKISINSLLFRKLSRTWSFKQMMPSVHTRLTRQPHSKHLAMLICNPSF